MSELRDHRGPCQGVSVAESKMSLRISFMGGLQ